MSKKYLIPIGSAIIMLMLSACSMIQPSTPTVDPRLIYTQAALTVQAQFTQEQVTPTTDTQIPAITETSAVVTATSGEISHTPTASLTPQPTATATTTPGECEDNVDFVRDISIPDDTVIFPGETFIKTWRLLNAGTCTWTTDYKLVFESGELMNASTSMNLPTSVEPDDEFDLSIELKAPATPGTYKGNWLLSNAAGVKFGLGNDSDTPFYVQVSVQESTGELNLGSPTWSDPMNNGSNWYLLDEPNTKFEIEDGKLVMRSVDPGEAEEWGLATRGEIDDFYMEIKATTGEECSGLDRYGLLLRAPDPNKGYVYGFSCDGRYRIYKWDGENYQPIQEWKASAHIKSGPNQTNLLGIWLKGNTIRLYANRILLGEYTDSTYDSGQFGLFIGSSETEDFEVSIDELSYWLLDN
jgi:hypothetical protein